MKTLTTNKNTPPISVIVSSSDGYNDCWDPFFKLFKLYFPLHLASEVLFVTNSLTYVNPDLKVRTITTSEKNKKILPWSKRLHIALEQAKNEIVFILLEDLFLRSEGNEQKFKELIRLIYQHPEIGHIRFRSGPWRKEKSEFEDLDLIGKWTKYRISMQPGLWRKEVLKKHLVLSESAWDLENIGSWRSNVLNDRFYSISSEYLSKNGYIYDANDAGGLAKGKWVERDVKELFAKHQIKIDYNQRGFYTPGEQKKGRKKMHRKILSIISKLLKNILFIGIHLATFSKTKNK